MRKKGREEEKVKEVTEELEAAHGKEEKNKTKKRKRN